MREQELEQLGKEENEAIEQYKREQELNLHLISSIFFILNFVFIFLFQNLF